MDLHQLAIIHLFYSQFLMEIYTVSSKDPQRDETDMKNEIKKWLSTHKKNKTFGDKCRHEILFIEKEIDKSSLKELRDKISNIEKNCRIIKADLESVTLTSSGGE